MNPNKDLYSNRLFKVWAQKQGLLDTEKYLINTYLLNKNGRIIEAGTGGGRIIFEVEKLGFSELQAFDFVESMIEHSNSKKLSLNSNVVFKVADASNLDLYKSRDFDYLIYLQQVLCFLEKELFGQALKEAHRIGAKDGIYIFSFLNWDSKFYNPIFSWTINFFRAIRGEKKTKYQLPWLIIDGKINWKIFHSKQPLNLWFRKVDICMILDDQGFEIIEAKTGGQILGHKNSNSGQLYIVCKKSNN